MSVAMQRLHRNHWQSASMLPLPFYHRWAWHDCDMCLDRDLGRCSYSLIEHVPHDAKSLLEINRVLRPQGLFFCFNLPYKLSWTQNLAHLRGNYYHDRLYSKSQVHQLLDDSSLEVIDLWHRQLLPKNNIRYPQYRLFESIDQHLTEFTPFKYLATNIEFVAVKPDVWLFIRVTCIDPQFF
mgnify:CR=1 FL=1